MKIKYATLEQVKRNIKNYPKFMERKKAFEAFDKMMGNPVEVFDKIMEKTFGKK